MALTTLLVLYTLFSQTSEDLPKTAYVKMIDVWFFAVITLLFAIIIFHVVVEYLDQKRSLEEGSSFPKAGPRKEKVMRNNFVISKERKHPTQEDETYLTEKLMKIMRLFVVPTIFVGFNLAFWIYWFA